MSTFSINISTTTEATRYPLVSYTDVDLILNKLIDNTSKLINPVDLRDSILSLYSASGFKVTTPIVTPIEYIGIDTLNPAGRDNKKLIYLGKRSFSGTYSYTSTDDILSKFTYSILDSDIYFFNTKKDTISNNETKIKFLAGTSISLNNIAPYIKAEIVASTSSLTLDFVNTSPLGEINITSDYATVSFNDIVFPSISTSYASASNLQTLFYENGALGWGDITYGQLNHIGVTGVSLQIYGSPVNVNGYPLELSDSRKLPKTINDMIIGSTFSVESISSILRKLIYPYLSPLCSIEILPPYDGGFAEIGTYPIVQVRVTITKRSLPTLPATLTNMIPSIYPAINVPGQSVQSSVNNGVVISPITTATTSFVVSVTDGTQSASASTTIQGIYPYFYGYSAVSTMTTTVLGSLTKNLEPKGDKNENLSGTGNLFFIYDSNYGTLSNIYYLGNTVSVASYSTTTTVLSSPSFLWAGKQFRVYKWNNAPTTGNFEFKY